MNTTPTRAAIPLPPVTPSRHVAAAAAKAKAIAPPGQPRKTPIAKRVAQDSDEEDEAQDVLPALGIAPPARKIKTVPASKGGAPNTAPNTRVTRSSAVKKAGAIAPVPESPVKTSRNGPNKIPRLAATRTTAASRALALAQETRTRPQRNVPSPTPSRLPTLINSKRTHTSSLSDVANIKSKATAPANDAWVANNVAAVVVPASKSERPGLRSVRRRRSSFSSADVVA